MPKDDDKNGGLRGAVALSHFFLRERVRPGDRVADATCGRGRDTLLLAQLVGPDGQVWAFDLQEGALDFTGVALAEAGCLGQVSLLLAGHERMAEFIREPLRAVVFNLGYLPGGDRHLATQGESTIAALNQAASLLLPLGIIIVCIYTGHPGGGEEGEAVEQWGATLPPEQFNVWRNRQANRPPNAPYLLLIEKKND